MGNLGHPWTAERRAMMEARFGVGSERILRHVEYDTNGGCWLWGGSITPSTGYGWVSINHRGQGAHRLSWESFHGPIPAGLSVLHKCDVRACVNPAHLFLGTPKANMADMLRKGRGRPVHADAHPGAKLRSTDIPTIRERLSRGDTCRVIGNDYGVNECAINALRRGRTWKSVPTLSAAEDGGASALPSAAA